MSRAQPSFPLNCLSPPLTDVTSLTSASTTSSYIEDWIAHTDAANLPLSKVLKKRNRSLSPVTVSSFNCVNPPKRRRKSFGDRECDIAAAIVSNPLITVRIGSSIASALVNNHTAQWQCSGCCSWADVSPLLLSFHPYHTNEFEQKSEEFNLDR